MRIQTALCERNADFLRPLLPFGILHVDIPCCSWMRRTCCLRLTPPRGACLQKHSQDPNCQFQNPAGSQARFVLPAHGNQTSFTRPAASCPLLAGSPTIYQRSCSPSTPRPSAILSLSPEPPCAELLEDTEVGPERQGAFFQTFPSATPPPPFRRQPYKVPASPSTVNPRPEIGFGVASAGFP